VPLGEIGRSTHRVAAALGALSQLRVGWAASVADSGDRAAGPVQLVVIGAMSVEPALLGASELAVLNTGAGVLIHRGIRRVGRTLWHGAGPLARRWRR
jgi:hypothetical protein